MLRKDSKTSAPYKDKLVDTKVFKDDELKEA
jgi:hypothetical protein